MAQRVRGSLFGTKKVHSGASKCPACDTFCTISEAMKAQKRLNAAAGDAAVELALLRAKLVEAEARIAELESGSQ